MLNLIYFILICHGLTQILVHGKIFDKIRPKHFFFKCSMCVGFWSGVFVYVFSFFTELINFELSFINPILLGCISSGVCYILDKIIDDDGLRITGGNHEVR